MSAATSERRFIAPLLYFHTTDPVFNGNKGTVNLRFYSNNIEIHSAEIPVYKTAITTSEVVTVGGFIANQPVSGSITMSTTDFNGRGYRLDHKQVAIAEAIALKKFTEYRQNQEA